MQIDTVEQVIEVLGGYRQVACLVGTRPNAALMWKTRGAFPARTFVLLTRELTRLGHSAPSELWGMKEPPR